MSKDLGAKRFKSKGLLVTERDEVRFMKNVFFSSGFQTSLIHYWKHRQLQ